MDNGDDDYPDDSVLRAAGYPEALIQACFDDFQFSCRLSSGEHWEFSRAEYEGAWVRLFDVVDVHSGGDPLFPRGVCVRVSSITWVCVAPHGS